MKSREYWTKRFEEIEKSSNQIGLDTYSQIEPAFLQAQRSIQSEIDSWYARFAANNKVTIQDAKIMISRKELDELKWDVNEFIKYGKENALDKQWMKELENASAKFHISKLEALKLRTQQAMEVAFGNELDAVDKMARKILTEDYYKSIFEIQKGFNVGFDVGQIDERKLNLLVNRPWATDGKNFSSRIWERKRQMVSELHQELTRTLIQGKSPDEAIRHMEKFVQGKVKNASNAAGRLVMTEQAYFHSVSQKEAFNYLDVEEFEIVATLDGHTSEICQEMDGKHFPMDEYSPGVTAPPFHVYCRSVTCPYFNDEWSIGERAARNEDGETYYVPSDMKYSDWKSGFVDGDISTLTNVAQKDTIKLKDNIMKDLADISEVKSNNDIKTFAEQLIDNLNIDRTNITISVKGSTDHGHCVFGQDATQDIIHYKEYVLNANDKRSMTHRVKTAFHESFHLSAEGMEWDGLDSSGRIKEAWRSLEETFTESSAHYMLEKYGVSEKIAPSYPKELVTNLPRLKQLPKYSSCNTIQDFGEIAFTDRQNGVGAKWINLSKQMKKVKLADDYYKQYHEYIVNNEDDLFDMFLGNMPGFEQYRSSMKIDLKSAMNKDRMLLNDNEQTVYYGILSCVMQKVGVK